MVYALNRNNGADTEMIESSQFLAVYITYDLSWTDYIDATAKEAHQAFISFRDWGKSTHIQRLLHTFKNAPDKAMYQVFLNICLVDSIKEK